MRQKVEYVSEERAPKLGCHHYWLIEGANGPISRGVCKLCGAEREFLNSLPEITVVKGRNTRLFDLPELSNVEVGKGSSS